MPLFTPIDFFICVAARAGGLVGREVLDIFFSCLLSDGPTLLDVFRVCTSDVLQHDSAPS